MFVQCPLGRCDGLQSLKELVRIKVACLVGISRRLKLELNKNKRKLYINEITKLEIEIEQIISNFEAGNLNK